MENTQINPVSNIVNQVDYNPINSIDYSELKVGHKYSFTYENKEMEGILIKKKSIQSIQIKLTKKPENNLTYSMGIAYTKTYINNVKSIDNKIYGFDREDLVSNYDEESDYEYNCDCNCVNTDNNNDDYDN